MGEHQYGFIHASLVEYFATRAMYEEIQDKMSLKTADDDKDKEEREIDKTRLRVQINPKGGSIIEYLQVSRINTNFQQIELR